MQSVSGGNFQNIDQVLVYYSRIANFIPDALVFIDAHYGIIGWNQAAESLYGWRAGEVSGLSIDELLETNCDSRTTGLAWDEIVAAGAWNGEVTQANKSGQRLPLYLTISAIKNSDGNQLGWLVHAQDFRSQYDLKNQLDESEQKFSTLFYSNPLAQSIFRLDGSFVEANQAFYQLTGFSQVDLIKNSTALMDLFPADERDRLQYLLVSENGAWQDVETNLLTKDQKPCTVLCSISTLTIQGKFHSLFSAMDITRRVEEEKKLSRMERLYATLSQVNQTIIRASDTHELYQSICDIAVDYGGFNLTWVSLLDETSGDLRPTAANGLDIDAWPIPITNIRKDPYRHSLTAEAFNRSMVVTSNNILDEQTQAYFEQFTSMGYCSMAVIPIHCGGNPVGVISIVSDQAQLFLAPEELSLLNEMSLDVSFALDNFENARLLQQWAHAFEHCAHGIAILPPKAERILTCNPPFALLQDRSSAEVMQTPFLELYVAKDRDLVRNAIQQADADGGAQFEAHILCNNGQECPVQIDLVSVRNLNGQLLYRVITQEDISERKRAEGQIRYQAYLLEHVKDAIVAADQDFHITAWNQGAEAIFGWSAEEAIGQISGDLLVTYYPGYTRGDFLERLPTQGDYSGEASQLRKDGTRIPVELSIMALRLENGEVSGYVSVIRDITARKQAERELLASERKLKLFVENAPAAIAMFDREMRYLAASRRYQLDYRLPNQDILGHSHYEIFPEIPDRWKEIHRRCLDGAVEMCEDDPFPRQDGSMDWVRWEIHPWYEENGSVGGIILFSEVITDRKLEQIELLHRTQDLMFMQALNEAVNRGDDLETIADVLANEARKTFHSQGTVIYLLNSEHNRLEMLGTAVSRRIRLRIETLLGRSIPRVRIRLQEGGVLWGLLQTEQGLITGDHQIIQSWIDELSNSLMLPPVVRPLVKRFVPRIFGMFNIHNALTIPLITSGKTIGILNMSSESEYSPEDLQRIRNISQQITAVILRKQAESQVQLQLKRMRALHIIDLAISSKLELQSSLDVFLKEVISQLGVDAASILLLDPQGKILDYVAGKGFYHHAVQKVRIPIGEGLAGQVGLTQKSIHLTRLDQLESPYTISDPLKKEGFVEYFGIPLIAKGALKGVFQVFHRIPLETDPEWIDYLETLAGQAAVAVDNAQLFAGLERSNQELSEAYDATITGWSHAMDLRDKETEGHTLRVTELTLLLADKMGFSAADRIHLRRGALLHDIGKLGVPDHILFKTTELSDAEWVIMRQHPTFAMNMLRSISYLQPALDIPYCHHEKWDGTGYPRGLKGEQIPLAARLFAVIDVWDALRSDRPYRPKWTVAETRRFIAEQSGKHFDPQVVEMFLSLSDEEIDQGH